ncbi:MAG: hypothetical protein JSU70_00415 [Phycisphaerales bacterium]|nr:MAG: hypothetical protein JSU70_00415 [Phycisphaerales bacterium]
MLTIDLLKGQGLPIKSRPEGIAIVGITVVVPLAIMAIMITSYLGDRIVISARTQEIARYKTRAEEWSDEIELHKSFEKEKNLHASYLSELRSAVGNHTQWSPVLATLAESMPDSVVLTKLEVNRRFVKKTIPKKGDPKKKVDISVPVSMLKMSVAAGPESNSDEAVRNLRDRLVQSDLLGPKLENISISQKSDAVDGQNVVSYQIDCLFKPAS